MRYLLPLVMSLMLFALSLPSYGGVTPLSPLAARQAAPLTSSELRETLSRLIELQASRARVLAQAEHIDRLEQLHARELELHAAQLKLEQQRTSIAERERDVEQSRADQYEDLLEARNRGRSAGCVMKKIFTFGIARC